MTNQLWVTSVVREDQVLPALVLCRSLKRTFTPRKIAVITATSLPIKSRDLLRHTFDYVFPLEEDRNVGHLPLEEFAKLSAFLLPETFQECVFLESNFLALRNMDKLFCFTDREKDIHKTELKNPLSLPSFRFSPNWNSFQLAMKFLENNSRMNLNQSLSLPGTALQLEITGRQCMLDEVSSNGSITLFGTKDSSDLAAAYFMKDPTTEQQAFNGIFKFAFNYWMEVFNIDVKPLILSGAGSLQPCRFPSFNREPIAIVGMSCRYPGANNLDSFWNLLMFGEDSVGKPPSFRWQREQCLEYDPEYRHTNAGFLSVPVDKFDCGFFELSPKDAEVMDPQHRLLLELVWECLENAGINPSEHRRTNGGVFLGKWIDDFRDIVRNSENTDFYRTALGNLIGAAVGRISMLLEWTGPSIATESGCSSSMVAVHLACKSLLQNECNMAVACGVNILSTPFDHKLIPLLSEDGRCKTFDENADGFCRSEGCGVLLLKRLSDAVRDGDKIWGLIRGSAVTQEGLSKSLGTPTSHCEALAMSQALSDGDVKPEHVSYVECHGTGTIIGDPLEMEGIARAYHSPKREGKLLVGSVKTNVGHTEACSGITGIMKVVLAMEEQVIPAHKNFTSLNPAVNLDKVPAEIPVEPVDWKRVPGKTRLAGVSSFGITGTDAHVIIEEAPEDLSGGGDGYWTERELDRSQFIMKICGKTEEALDKLMEEYKILLNDKSRNDCFSEIAFSANTTREDMPHAAIIIAKGKTEAAEMIENKKYLKSESSSQDASPKICFLFTGQGSQYPGMAREMYETCPVFRIHFDRCLGILERNYGVNLKKILWEEGDDDSKNEINKTIFSQTSIFCVEYALLKVWACLGVKPDFVLGHSLGEFAAAVCAGILSVEDALKLVAERSLLIDKLPQGKMLVVRGSQSTIKTELDELFGGSGNDPDKNLDFAAFNCEEQTVVAGSSEAILEFAEHLSGKGVECMVLASTHAFHSKHMDSILDKYRKVAESIKTSSNSEIGYISGMTGKLLTLSSNQICPEYWVKHTREPVNFVEASDTAFQLGCNLFIEIGPHPVLSAFILSNCLAGTRIRCFPSLSKREGDWTTFLNTIAKVYLESSISIRWKGLDSFCKRRRVALPNYPFNRKQYWPVLKKLTSPRIHPLLGSILPNASPTKLYEYGLDISSTSMEYLKGHCLGKYVVFPGAAYLEMMLAAGLAAIETGSSSEGIQSLVHRPIQVDNLEISAILGLESKGKCHLQSVVNLKDTSMELEVKIFHQMEATIGSGPGSWQLHSNGIVSPQSSHQQNRTKDNNFCDKEILSSLRQNLEKDGIAPDTKFYDLFTTPNSIFRSIPRFWKGVDEGNRLLAKVTPLKNLRQYLMHPVILDAMIQAIALLKLYNETQSAKNRIYLPVKVGKFVWSGRKLKEDDSVYIFVEEDQDKVGNNAPDDVSSCTAYLIDDDDIVFAEMSSVELYPTTVKSVEALLDRQQETMPELWEEVWRPTKSSSLQVDQIDLDDVYRKSKSILGNCLENANTLQEYFLQRLGQLGLQKQDKNSSIFRVIDLGNGDFSSDLLEALETLSINYEYTIINVSSENENKYEKYSPHIQFKTFDLAKDPLSQGYLPEYYDYAVALDSRPEFQENNLQILATILRRNGLLDWRSLNTEDADNCIFQDSGFDLVATFTTVDQILFACHRREEICHLKGKEVTNPPCWIIVSPEESANSSIPSRLKSKLEYARRTVLEFLPDDNLGEILTGVDGRFKGEIEGIIYCLMREEDEDNTTSQEKLLKPYFELVKHVTSHFENSCKIFAITSGAAFLQSKSEFSSCQYESSTLWGFTQSVANELGGSGWLFRCVDISSSERDVDQVFHELWNVGNETQVAFRDGTRYIPRFQQFRRSEMGDLTLPPGRDRFQLQLPATKLISDLQYVPLEPFGVLGELEMEIQVKAAALNFRDVLVVLKPVEYFEKVNKVGYDVAGVVTQVGSEVTKWNAGDLVFTIDSRGGPLPTHVKIHQDFAFRMSEKLSFCEAATLPVVHMTTYHSLVGIAQVKSADVVLIHAASGGVGISAIQLCRHLKVKEIICTAGSPRKRNYLRKVLKIIHVFNSRSTEYADKILAITEGRGVDVVLNSLTGPGFKEATLKCCAVGVGARFVEIGKLSVWTPEEARDLRPDVEYHTIDLYSMKVERMTELISEVGKLLAENGVLSPIPFVRYSGLQIRDALTYLQRAKHIGKVVVTMPELKMKDGGNLEVYNPLFTNIGTYIITGGLGGIGFAVSKWMLENGAMHILLCGRSPPSPSKLEEIKSMNKESGSHVVAISLDVADYDKCSQLINSLPQLGFPPLGGIFHCAGTISDGLLQNQTWPAFESTFSSKVCGTWNLHQLTKHLLNLEYFVVFSSISALLGTPGQCNYAAGNKYKDAICHHRHSLGLPATTINWGQWAEIGIARMMDLSGMKPFSSSHGIAALEYTLRNQLTQLCAANLDFALPAKILYPNLAAYVDENLWKSSGATASSKNQIKSSDFWESYEAQSSDEERVQFVVTLVKNLLRRLLKFDETEVLDENVDIQKLGVDSLSMIEMKNELQCILGDRVKLQGGHLQDSKTILLIATKIVTLIQQHSGGGGGGSHFEEPTFDEIQKLIREDSQLPEHIPEITDGCQVELKDVRTVLLAGGTGNLGSYVLRELVSLPQIVKVVCLLTERGKFSSEERLRQVLDSKELLQEIDMIKVECVFGDISKEKLGLEEETWTRLVSEVDAVFNCAVVYRHLDYYRKTESENLDARAVNVEGVKNIIAFAGERKLKYIFHSSNIFMESKFNEDGISPEAWPDVSDYNELSTRAYPVSKFVGEIVLKQASERGVACRVFRFPHLLGDSKSGRFHLGLNHLKLRYLFAMKNGILAPFPLGLFMLPVDICARISLAAFFDERTPNSDVFDVLPEMHYDEEDFSNLAEEFGHKVKTVGLEEFTKFVEDVETTSSDPVSVSYKEVCMIDSVMHGMVTKWTENIMPDWKQRKLRTKVATLLPELYEDLETTEAYLRKDIIFAKTQGWI